MNSQNLPMLSGILRLPEVDGTLRTRLQVKGTLDTTEVSGGVMIEDFQYQSFSMDTIVTYLNFADIKRFEQGHLFTEIRNGSVFGKRVVTGNLSLESRNDSLIVHTLQLSDRTGNLFMEGAFSKSLKGVVSKLQLKYNELFLHNRTDIPLSISESGVNVADGMIGINNGFIGISGTFHSLDSLQANVKFTNLDLAPFNNLLAEPVPFTGKMNGNVEFRRSQQERAFQTDLEITNAIWRDLYYDRIRCVGNYYDGLITITN